MLLAVHELADVAMTDVVVELVEAERFHEIPRTAAEASLMADWMSRVCIERLRSSDEYARFL